MKALREGDGGDGDGRQCGGGWRGKDMSVRARAGLARDGEVGEREASMVVTATAATEGEGEKRVWRACRIGRWCQSSDKGW